MKRNLVLSLLARLVIACNVVRFELVSFFVE